MSELTIGVWVKRPGGKYHLVESVVAEDAVTRCGRRMDRVASRGELQVSALMPLTRLIGQPQLCRAGCLAGGVATDPSDYQGQPDDDGSTHDESEPA